jgi:hypothetical protein
MSFRFESEKLLISANQVDPFYKGKNYVYSGNFKKLKFVGGFWFRPELQYSLK